VTDLYQDELLRVCAPRLARSRSLETGEASPTGLVSLRVFAQRAELAVLGDSLGTVPGFGTLETIVARYPVRSGDASMQVREAMTKVVLTVGPGHTLRRAAEQMAQRNVGAAVVLDPDGMGLGILTERDILHSVGQGQDVDREAVGAHQSGDLLFASAEWSLEQAAAAMVRGGFRHLVVVEGGETVGILSVRDIVRCWTDDGAICEVPASAA
jgi:CBS domain-containing protein